MGDFERIEKIIVERLNQLAEEICELTEEEYGSVEGFDGVEGGQKEGYETDICECLDEFLEGKSIEDYRLLSLDIESPDYVQITVSITFSINPDNYVENILSVVTD